MHAPVLLQYATIQDVYLPLYKADGTAIATGVTFANGDVTISKDGGTHANIGTLPTEVATSSGTYKIRTSAAETTCSDGIIIVSDQTATQTWLDTAISFQTYGNASAKHAFDLGVAQQSVTVASMNTGVVTNAAIAASAITPTEASVNTSQVAGNATAATNLSASTRGIVTGAAIAGTLSTTQMTTDLTETTDDWYIDRTIVFYSGALAGVSTVVEAYTGSSKLLTFATIPQAPVATQAFVIV